MSGIAAGQPLTGNSIRSAGFAVPALEIHDVAAAGRRLAVLSTSSMGERTLSVHGLGDGEQLLQRRLVTSDFFGFTGSHLAYETSEGIVVTHVDSAADAVIDRSSTGGMSSWCLSDRGLHGVMPSSGTSRFVEFALSGGAAVREDLAEGEFTGMLCARSRVLAYSSTTNVAFSFVQEDWQSVDLEGYVPAVISDTAIYALQAAGSSVALFRREFGAGRPWQEIYRTVDGNTMTELIASDDDRFVTFLERAASGSTNVTRTSSDGKATRRASLDAGRFESANLWAVDQDVLIAIGRRNARSWAFFSSLALETERPDVTTSLPSLGDADRTPLALDWLERQMGPVFLTRHGLNGRLIDSYEDSRSVGWTYDAAAAAIALTAWGRTEPARMLLAGLAHVQRSDGSWEFAYDPVAAVSIAGDRYLGSMAWVVMAANFYQWETGDAAFSAMADEALTFIDRFVTRDMSSPLNGGVSMGPVAPQTFSAEHNADAYSAFEWRGRIANRPDYRATAEGIRQFMLRELWPAGSDHFNVGHRDRSLYLDPQTWVALALAATDGAPADRFSTALATAEQRLRVAQGSLGEARQIAGFRDADTADPLKVWSEGTEGMVAALLSVGRFDEARFYHEQTMRIQTPSGGIPYATENTDGWPSTASVAGTAWVLLNRAWPPRNPFVPDPSAWKTLFGDSPRLWP